MVISLNKLANSLTRALLADAASLRLTTYREPAGALIVDAGIEATGGLEAGRRIGEICMAGLGQVSILPSATFALWPWQVSVATSQPVLACLASQYAGWSLSNKDPKFHALGSGAARALAAKEPLFTELDYTDSASEAVLVLETDRIPPPPVVEEIASDCAVDSRSLTLILTPTTSLAGGVQIAARVVEVALHKAHELKFPIAAIVDAVGSTPLPPPTADGLKAMGRTNDSILFGGQVQLWVDADDQAAEELAKGLPSGNSADYGKPFAQVFADYNFDFFAIDPMLFSPARVAITALRSGQTFHGGQFSEELLDRSFNA